LLDKIKELQSSILELDNELREFMRSGPEVEDACLAISELNFLKRDLSIVYDDFSNSVLALMGETDGIMLSNGAQIEKKCAYGRTGWKHKDLGADVVDRIMEMSINMDTGEIVKSPREVALEILDYCAPSYWRVKELNKIGINPDNYCDVGELKSSLIVRKMKNN